MAAAPSRGPAVAVSGVRASSIPVTAPLGHQCVVLYAATSIGLAASSIPVTAPLGHERERPREASKPARDCARLRETARSLRPRQAQRVTCVITNAVITRSLRPRQAHQRVTCVITNAVITRSLRPRHHCSVPGREGGTLVMTASAVVLQALPPLAGKGWLHGRKGLQEAERADCVRSLPHHGHQPSNFVCLRSLLRPAIVG